MPKTWTATFRRPMSWFFLFVSISVIVTFMVPAAFGLQHFTQWGGMYSNSWCLVQLADRNPLEHNDAQIEDVTAGLVTRAVWSYPMHNRQTCAVWAKKYCGKQAKAGWTISWVRPFFKDEHYMDPDNMCDLDIPASYSSWFQDVTQ